MFLDNLKIRCRLTVLKIFLLLICLTSVGWAQNLSKNQPPSEISNNYLKDLKSINSKWRRHTPIMYVFVEDGSSVADWNPQYNQLLFQAFHEWSDTLEGRFIFQQIQDKSQADLCVKWSYQDKESAMDELASGAKIGSGGVTLGLHDAYEKPFAKEEVYATCLHEIGHALGITGHSSNPEDIMYFVACEQKHLSSRDIETLKIILGISKKSINQEDFQVIQEANRQDERAFGNELYRAREYQGAFSHYKTAYDMYPYDDSVNFFLGYCARKLDNLDFATKILMNVANHPNKYQHAAQRQLGYLYTKTGFANEQVHRYRQAALNYRFALSNLSSGLLEKDLDDSERQAIIKNISYAQNRLNKLKD